MVTQAYIENLIKHFNNKTGLKVNYKTFYDNLTKTNKSNKQERDSYFCDAYELFFADVIDSYGNKAYTNEENKKDRSNIMQEIDAMMNHIYELSFKEKPKFKYGYPENEKKGLKDRRSFFNKYVNQVTDKEYTLKKDNRYNEANILSALNSSYNNFDPIRYKNSEEKGTEINELAENLKVARNHYHKKGWLSRLFSFSERKAIDKAKDKLAKALAPANTKVTDKMIDKYIDDSIRSSTHCADFVSSLNKEKYEAKDVSDFKKVDERAFAVINDLDKEPTNQREYRHWLKVNSDELGLDKMSSIDRHIMFNSIGFDKSTGIQLTNDEVPLNINNKDVGEVNLDNYDIIEENELNNNLEVENVREK